MAILISLLLLGTSIPYNLVDSASVCQFSARGAEVYRDAGSFELYRRAIIGSASPDEAFKPAEGQLPRWNPKAPDEPQMPKLPPIDWKSSQVIAIHAGSCPTGGYRVLVRRVSILSAKMIEVDAHLQKPGSHDIVSQMVTHPWINIRTARASGQIRLVWI